MTDDTDQQLTQSQQLVKIARRKYEFGQSQDHSPFAKPTGGSPVATSFRGTKDSMRAELAAAYLELFDKPPSAAALADSLTALQGLAMRQEQTDLHLRVARQPDGSLAVDLGRPDGRTVVIHEGTWTVTCAPGVTWRRTALTSPMPDPVGGGDPLDLGEHINVTDDDLPLLLAWCVAALDPDVSHPLVLLTGEQGTGKSVAARTIAQLLDPSPAPLRAAPRSMDDWVVAASASWVVALDNMSSVPLWLSDLLCKTSTGGGAVKRSLYSDADVAVVDFQRPVMLTSIDAGALKGDLAERLVVLDLERLGGRRAAESELTARLEADRPALLGALLDLAAQVQHRLPYVQLDGLPRMADFAKVVAAVDQVLGTDALGRYLKQTERLAIDVLEGDSVASALLDLLDADPHIEASASSILDRLDLARGDGRAPRDWPTTPQGMAGALKRLAPALRTHGVEVEYLGRTRHDRDRLWELVRRDEGVGDQTAETADTAAETAHDNPAPADPAVSAVPVPTSLCDAHLCGERREVGRYCEEHDELLRSA